MEYPQTLANITKINETQDQQHSVNVYVKCTLHNHIPSQDKQLIVCDYSVETMGPHSDIQACPPNSQEQGCTGCDWSGEIHTNQEAAQGLHLAECQPIGFLPN